MNAILRYRSFAVVSVCMILLLVGAICADAAPDLAALATDAISASDETSRAAIEALREAGPEGLNALLAVSPGESDLARWRTAVDTVAAQRDATSSRLYWYTDLDEAQAAARSSGKPILSLYMLGKLTDEYSCANSRFFRTVLYANQEVSGRLRERFVLHWSTVRSAPQVTIDFGDGRKLKRTITGNSIHYVLDRRGRVVNALPGLYGPKAFLRALDAAEVAAQVRGSRRRGLGRAPGRIPRNGGPKHPGRVDRRLGQIGRRGGRRRGCGRG